jgi:tetratricopeptide (TPR) repeat protein
MPSAAMKKIVILSFFVLAILAFACKKNTPIPKEDWEAVALNGKKLYPPKESAASLRTKDSLLAIAQANFDADSNNLENIIWLGRRTAYQSRYKDAIEIFSRGIRKFPESPELYRHRGHRYISVRNFDSAIQDLQKAAALAKGRPSEIEPDGIPNQLNLPLSSLQFNIYYHLGLAYYLKGEFQTALTYYDTCMQWSVNPDLLTATADWTYMALRRTGQEEQAKLILEKITPDLEVIENDAYLQRLLMYKGLIAPKSLLDLGNTDELVRLNVVTQGYGVGNWYLCNGDTARARNIFSKILETEQWAAFGYIAAEADLYRFSR